MSTAAMAYFMFGKTLRVMALAGMVTGIVGVALILQKSEIATPEP